MCKRKTGCYMPKCLTVPAYRESRVSFSHSLQTPAPALYPQGTLALAAIYLSARLATPQIALPLAPVPWWTLFDTNEDEILDICSMLLKLYAEWGSGLDRGESNDASKTTSVWRRAGSLPLDKRAVRDRLASIDAARASQSSSTRDEASAASNGARSEVTVP